MVKVISVYGDDGKKIGELAACSHKPFFLWRDIIMGLGLALLGAMLFFA